LEWYVAISPEPRNPTLTVTERDRTTDRRGATLVPRQARTLLRRATEYLAQSGSPPEICRSVPLGPAPPAGPRRVERQLVCRRARVGGECPVPT
jgi:hypothetical protein